MHNWRVLIIITALLFSVFVVAGASNKPYVELYAYSPTCYTNGSFSLTLENSGTIDVETKDISVYTTKQTKNITLEGGWSKDYIEKGREVPGVTFSSQKGVFNKSRNYSVFVRYPECKTGLSCELIIPIQGCPGYSYDCEISKPEITECYTKAGKHHIYFRGVNSRQYKQLDHKKDILYQIKSDKWVYDWDSEIYGMNITALGDDSYYVVFPLGKEERVLITRIKVEQCQGIQGGYASATCGFAQTCTNDVDCGRGKFCGGDGYCELLMKGLITATSCPLAQCSDWRLAYEINNGEVSIRTCNRYSEPPQCTQSASEESKTFCDTGYISDTFGKCVQIPTPLTTPTQTTTQQCPEDESSESCVRIKNGQKCVETTKTHYLDCSPTTIESSEIRCSKGYEEQNQECVITETTTGNLRSITYSLIEGKDLSFDLLGRTYSISTQQIGRDHIELKVGDGVNRLEVQQTKYIDIDNDGNEDLSVKLDSIESGKANIEVVELEGKEKKSTWLMVPFFLVIIVLTALYLGRKYLKTTFLTRKTIRIENEEGPVSFTEGVSKDVRTAIEVSAFTVKHGRDILLDSVRFDIEKGEMICLLGPSGAGKTTILDALAGRKEPTKGNIKIFEKDVRNKEVKQFIGFVPQNPEIYNEQTVEQNLKNSAIKWGVKDEKKLERILYQIKLHNKKDVKARNLSGGQKKLLSLGMELMHDAELFVLDEPTTGLDPNTRNEIITLLSQLVSQQHKTILFSTHFMDDAEDCDKVIIVADSKIVAYGPPSKLEKMLPGGGKIVEVVLDMITSDLIKKIERISGVEKVIVKGRNLNILTNDPDTVEMASKIKQLGGVINESRISKATMMEVFVYHTGEKPE